MKKIVTSLENHVTYKLCFDNQIFREEKITKNTIQ